MEFYREKFKEIRLQKNFKLLTIAKKTGISRTSLWHWEKGDRSPAEKNLRALAKLLNVSVNQISDLPPDLPHSDMLNKENAKLITDNIIHSSNVSKWDSKYKSSVKELLSHFDEAVRSIEIIQSLIKYNAVSMYVKDMSQKYLLASAEFLSQINYNNEGSITGLKDRDIFPELEAKFNSEEDERVLTSGEAVKNREGHIPGSRKKRVALISKSPVFDKAGRISGLIGSFIDISEQVRLQELSLKIRNTLNLIDKTIYLADGRVIDQEKGFYFSNSFFLSDNPDSKEFFQGLPEDATLLDKLDYYVNNKLEGSSVISLEKVIKKGRDSVYYQVKVPGTTQARNCKTTYYYNNKHEYFASVTERDTAKDEIELLLDKLKKIKAGKKAIEYMAEYLKERKPL